MSFLRVEDGKKDKKKIYLPLLLVDEMRSRLKDLIVRKINVSCTENGHGKVVMLYIHGVLNLCIHMHFYLKENLRGNNYCM